MATFCANDTCSVALGTDEFGRLEADAILSSTGALQCVEGQGLGINIFGTTGVAPGTLNACDQNLLGITTDNRLFVRRPGFEVVEVAGTLINFPDTNADVNSSSFTVTNAGTCTRLFIYRAKMTFNFTVVANGPYSADGTFHVDTSLGANSPASSFEIGGDGIANGFHIHTAFLTDWITFGAGQSIDFDLLARRNADVNIDGTGPGGGGGTNGFLGGFRGVMLDLAQDGSVIS